MYHIAATLPTLRPILTKTLSSLSSLSLFSKLSQFSQPQKSETSSEGAVEGANGNRFVKLDDYHYMHNSKSANRFGRNSNGVLRTTAISVSDETNTDIEEHELTRYAH
jgi:hypothetical protein